MIYFLSYQDIIFRRVSSNCISTHVALRNSCISICSECLVSSEKDNSPVNCRTGFSHTFKTFALAGGGDSAVAGLS